MRIYWVKKGQQAYLEGKGGILVETDGGSGRMGMSTGDRSEV